MLRVHMVQRAQVKDKLKELNEKPAASYSGTLIKISGQHFWTLLRDVR